MKKTFKFLIIDDHQLFADGLARILEEEDNFTLTGIFNALDSSASIDADLVLLDIQLGVQSGLDLCTWLRERYTNMIIILISMIQAPHLIREGQKRGANGFISKTTDAELLKETVVKICRGENIFLGLPEKGSSLHEVNLLSEREMQIIHLIKQGLTSKMIAEKLFLSEFTVETHRKNILRKLKLNTANELIAYAYANHL
ncbi:response regulator transcription factor [Fulvivirga ulvae]|uniref:LuxR C-terminal-related transcriptional regulator n=1 Tax=Fulvivirga ulvae TaxID=2904245 RepID=UPI001F3672FF|nr:response regulator transcription factor [Fulvivirga ulvae]UII33176.1 response regulator transcription factor [Fulvivirga ulvae]